MLHRRTTWEIQTEIKVEQTVLKKKKIVYFTNYLAQQLDTGEDTMPFLHDEKSLLNDGIITDSEKKVLIHLCIKWILCLKNTREIHGLIDYLGLSKV